MKQKTYEVIFKDQVKYLSQKELIEQLQQEICIGETITIKRLV